MIKAYIDYFRHQAASHPALLHTAERRVFEVASFEEAWGDFRTAMKERDYMMRLILPNGKVVGDADDNITVLGGFIIAKYWDKRNEGDQAIESALDKSFEVGTDILTKMIHDSNNEHPLWYWTAGSATVLDVSWQTKLYTGDTQYAGILFTFRWQTSWMNCISHSSAPAWTDGGETPFTS